MQGRVVGGKYTLERELAQGGMGAVWVAQDTSLRRRVAVKLLRPDRESSPNAHARFEREAMAVAALKSPHVVSIFDYGIDASSNEPVGAHHVPRASAGGEPPSGSAMPLPYIVMELLDGEDLHARLARVGKLPVASASTIVTQVAKALAAAHAAGIIHRDVKPANIFLARHDDTEAVKVLDFGVAALVSGLSSDLATRSGGMVGTPHYMSPEQVRGATNVDFRSDLWSLGVVAYNALTGRLPFDGDAFGELLIQICTDPVPPPSKLGLSAELGAEADRFFERALDRDPQKRFGSARELATAFASLASAEGVGPARVLVVDDEPDIALLMKQRFRHQIRSGRFEFLFASDGEEALEQLRVNPDIEIVLTDINMPGMDGLTFLRRASDQNPVVKVVVVSAYSDMSNIREAMNRGAFDFLVKPIDFRDLEATIDKTVRHARDARRTQRSSEENGLLRMFVGSRLTERLFAGPASAPNASALDASETSDATVAFIGFHGAHGLHDVRAAGGDAAADQALRTLNANFEIVLPEIAARGGHNDGLFGDVAMAVFRGPAHLLRAVDACIAVRRALLDLAHRAGPGSPYGHGVAIGLDSGPIVAGRVGSRRASRLGYAVLGEAAVAAARLQREASAQGRILVRAALEAKLRGDFETQPVIGVGEDLEKRGEQHSFEVMRRLAEGASSAAETVVMISALAASEDSATPTFVEPTDTQREGRAS